MKKILILGIMVGMGLQAAYAGNPDRKGEPGAVRAQSKRLCQICRLLGPELFQCEGTGG